ncbi:DUF1766-domain-containing protein [Polyplosphaeria fusca]|uniref:DUF1766-domain-containing protein n=1 Tax=Polyplosphaeria fusca TaxID=682080 RepID=A0A9P4QRI8_9PLEO|nr:DUF1766-domain-containing protein [Polyplosphaeria fusca]
MPFTGHTPESLLPRSDSKNPATTCKGITSSGRPCRRGINTAKASRTNGVLAVVSVVSDDNDEEEEGLAVFFCWQHKDQAEQLAAANAAEASNQHGQNTTIFPLQNRSSIDTLVARLGVVDEEPPEQRPQRQKENRPLNRPPNRRVHRPPTWDRVQGPLMSVPSDLLAENRRTSHRPQPKKKKKKGFWASLCCGSADDDYVEVIRHKKRVDNPPLQMTSQYPVQSAMTERPPSHNPGSQPSSNIPARKPLAARPDNKTLGQATSQTSNLLAHIPGNIAPQTASALLAELSKPISPHDDEGYIYIFWLTPETAGPAPSSTASSLLAPPSRPEHGRRTSDVLRQYSVRRPQRPDLSRRKPGEHRVSTSEKDTILLKIGRASNVHRRMTEWTRQCGYSLSLVRWYPYVSSTPTPSPQGSPANSRRPSYQNQRPSDGGRRVSEGVRKVPHAHRVERLIHLELAEQRVKKNCDACGKEHREWFEVEATREGVKAIDEVVRRWVDWAEKASAQSPGYVQDCYRLTCT